MKKYRFFGGKMKPQENWLNKMANRGLRLVNTGIAWYEFEESPRPVQYAVEFVGHLSREEAEDYRCFLEDMGYRVFYKNSNRITRSRDLFLVEKPDNGKPFQLHTDYSDLLSYYRAIVKKNGTYRVALCALALLSTLLFTWCYCLLAAWLKVGIHTLLPESDPMVLVINGMYIFPVAAVGMVLCAAVMLRRRAWKKAPLLLLAAGTLLWLVLPNWELANMAFGLGIAGALCCMTLMVDLLQGGLLRLAKYAAKESAA